MVRVRFAPSPTGHLHQGNVRTALFNYLFARKHGGTLILRIEDTDQERSQLDFEKSIYADLNWLGLAYQEGPEVGGEFGPYRQSERNEIYRKYLSQLEEMGKVYPCFCTQEDLEAERRRALATNKPYRYSGKCRELKSEERQAKRSEGAPYTLRFAVERGVVKFNDLVYGEKVFDTATIGDFVLTRSNEMPLYLFTCAIDDVLMKVTHVIRGEDGISNTPRQILIQQALGFEPPAFAHLPLILGPDHTLLSKRNGSTSVMELKDKGYLAPALINYLALLGWAPPEGKEVLDLEQLIAAFDLSRVSRSSAIFDWAKLNHLNHLYLLRLPDADYLAMARQALAAGGFAADAVSAETLEKTLLAVRPNIQTLSEVGTWVNWLLHAPAPSGAEAEEVLKTPETKKVLQAAFDQLQSASDELKIPDYEALMESLKKATKVKGKKLFMPLRVVLTGSTEGPELAQLVSALGKQKLLERIQRGLESLQ